MSEQFRALNWLLTSIQGGGKGTQLKLLRACYPELVSGFSSGDACRAIKTRDTAVIRSIIFHLQGISEDRLVSDVTTAMDAGRLVHFDYLFAMFKAALGRLRKNQIGFWDGLPRDWRQACAMLQEFLIWGWGEIGVIQIALPDATARIRIADRAIAEGRPDDASPEAVAARLEIFHAEHDRMIRFFRKAAKEVPIVMSEPIDGSLHPREIAYQIQSITGLPRVSISDDLLRSVGYIEKCAEEAVAA